MSKRNEYYSYQPFSWLSHAFNMISKEYLSELWTLPRCRWIRALENMLFSYQHTNR